MKLKHLFFVTLITPTVFLGDSLLMSAVVVYQYFSFALSVLVKSFPTLPTFALTLYKLIFILDYELLILVSPFFIKKKFCSPV